MHETKVSFIILHPMNLLFLQQEPCFNIFSCCCTILLTFPLGRKEIFYLTSRSTHVLMVIRMVKDHWDSVRGKSFRHMGYSFWLAARVLLYASSHRQENIYHGLCYTSRGAQVGTIFSSMVRSRRIDPTTHRTMSERSKYGTTSRSFSIGFIYR